VTKEPWEIPKSEFLETYRGVGPAYDCLYMNVFPFTMDDIELKANSLNIIVDYPDCGQLYLAYCDENCLVQAVAQVYRDQGRVIGLADHLRGTGMAQVIAQSAVPFGMTGIEPSKISEGNSEFIHEFYVRKAKAEGKKIPKDVLYDYPNIDDPLPDVPIVTIDFKEIRR